MKLGSDCIVYRLDVYGCYSWIDMQVYRLYK